jgi:hypothetical protein
MTTSIKSVQAIIKNNTVQLRLRLKNGTEKFINTVGTGHTLNSASVWVETMANEQARSLK